MLFIDDHHIHSCRGVRRRFHRLSKHPDNPVKVFTDPWGSTLANHGGFEIDPLTSEFVLWYSTRPVDPESVTDARFICQARSGDGVHWETPPLGLFEFRGSRDNNICVVNYPYSGVYPGPHELTGPCIARDPLDPDPSARYKMALWRYNRDHDPETGEAALRVEGHAVPDGPLHQRLPRRHPLAGAGAARAHPRRRLRRHLHLDAGHPARRLPALRQTPLLGQPLGQRQDAPRRARHLGAAAPHLLEPRLRLLVAPRADPAHPTGTTAPGTRST